MCNLGQSNFDLFIDYTYTKIMITSVMSLNLFRRQGNAVVKLAGCSLEQPPYYRNVSFGYLFSLNHKGLACLIDKII